MPDHTNANAHMQHRLDAPQKNYSPPHACLHHYAHLNNWAQSQASL